MISTSFSLAVQCSEKQTVTFLVRADLHGTIFVACDKLTTGLQLAHYCRVRQKKMS